MIIGLDFDNTIVRYDRVFHEVAIEKGFIDLGVPMSKVAVRNAMQEKGLGDDWTEMQGYVYGQRMERAEIFAGAVALIRRGKNHGHEFRIISHKTQFPYMGPKYDLHDAARSWLKTYFLDELGALVEPNHISFHETKARKMARIEEEKCDVFLDDLPEILLAPEFPVSTKAVLFDPDDHHAGEGLTRVKSWDDFGMFLKL